MQYPLLLPSELTHHLRAFRKTRGLSQTQLGVRLGLSQSRIARMEKAPAQISVDGLMQMLEALGVRIVLSDGQADPALSTAAVEVPGDW